MRTGGHLPCSEWHLALPVSQLGITMLVSVENLEEAGEQVSFWLQIRRYWTGEVLDWGGTGLGRYWTDAETRR